MAYRALFTLFILLASFTVQAQVYKWVGPDGKVTYSDMPPPPSATNVETKILRGNDASTSALPYELSQAVDKMPVTLYTAKQCIACDQGRTFLKQNGIPFTEKTVSSNDDLDKLKQVSGETQIPFLIIGPTKLKGYGDSQWRSNLSLAGYPESNQLPADYHFSTPQPAAQKAEPPRSAEQTSQPSNPDVPARDPNGFQF